MASSGRENVSTYGSICVFMAHRILQCFDGQREKAPSVVLRSTALIHSSAITNDNKRDQVMVSTVTAYALVLKHQSMNIPDTDSVSVVQRR